jgi:hypothetical protein
MAKSSGSRGVHQALLDRLYGVGWVVYAKRPFAGPEQVFKYLSRYTHRTGVSNKRLVSFHGNEVCFHTKGGKTVTLAPEEFIGRFLLHVLPSGYVKIRHYGLMASSNAKTKLPLAQRLLQAVYPTTRSVKTSVNHTPAPSSPDAEATNSTLPGVSPDTTTAIFTAKPATGTQETTTGSSVREVWMVLFKRLTGVDLAACPRCHQAECFDEHFLRRRRCLCPESEPRTLREERPWSLPFLARADDPAGQAPVCPPHRRSQSHRLRLARTR